MTKTEPPTLSTPMCSASNEAFGDEVFTCDGEANVKYKHGFDLAVIGVAAVLLLPFWLVALVAIPTAIWLEDRGPIFFRQDRVGLGGRVFSMVKFRTMKPDANEASLAAMDDPRVTRVGYVLRQFHADEIPQVVNVLRGEMSLVGPRAESVARHREILKALPVFNQRLRVKPGIAGLAQVRSSYWATPHEKLRYDNLYIRNLGPLQDLKLLLAAVITVIQRTSASFATREGKTATAPKACDL